MLGSPLTPAKGVLMQPPRAPFVCSRIQPPFKTITQTSVTITLSPPMPEWFHNLQMPHNALSIIIAYLESQMENLLISPLAFLWGSISLSGWENTQKRPSNETNALSERQLALSLIHLSLPHKSNLQFRLTSKHRRTEMRVHRAVVGHLAIWTTRPPPIIVAKKSKCWEFFSVKINTYVLIKEVTQKVITYYCPTGFNVSILCPPRCWTSHVYVRDNGLCRTKILPKTNSISLIHFTISTSFKYNDVTHFLLQKLM